MAIVVRTRKPNKSSIAMWLLQAKKLSTSTSPLPTNISTTKEIELLENMPDFLFERTNKSRVRFSLSKDFKCPINNYSHWSFLCFTDDPTKYQGSINPCKWRWPGVSPTITSGSFMDSLLSMCNGTLRKGALVDKKSPYSEWRSLWKELMCFGKTKNNSKHAGGPLIHSAFISSQLPFLNAKSISDPILFNQQGAYSESKSDFIGYDQPNKLLIKTTGFSQGSNAKEINEFMSWAIQEEELDNINYDDLLQANNIGNGGTPTNTSDDENNDGESGGIRQTLIIDII